MQFGGTYQSMFLCLLKIILPIEQIPPTIQEKPCPLALPNQEAPTAQALRVLREYEINLLGLEVTEGVDDRVRRDDGDILKHEGGEARRGKDVRVQGERRIHYQGVRGEGKHPGAVGVQCEGVADGGDEGPGLGEAVCEGGVGCGVCEEV